MLLTSCSCSFSKLYILLFTRHGTFFTMQKKVHFTYETLICSVHNAASHKGLQNPRTNSAVLLLTHGKIQQGAIKNNACYYRTEIFALLIIHLSKGQRNCEKTISCVVRTGVNDVKYKIHSNVPPFLMDCTCVIRG